MSLRVDSRWTGISVGGGPEPGLHGIAISGDCASIGGQAMFTPFCLATTESWLHAIEVDAAGVQAQARRTCIGSIQQEDS
ncbi:hypothetical protein ACIPR8_16585 [Stenotrophomonas sp. LARHCG68]